MTMENRKCLSTENEFVEDPDGNRSALADHLASALVRSSILAQMEIIPHPIQPSWRAGAVGWTSVRTSWVGAILSRGVWWGPIP
jgi:hypothetical protein